MNEVYVAIVLQIGTLLGLLITALVGARKVEKVHELVNGKSTQQELTIATLREDVRALAAKKRPGRPRKDVHKAEDGVTPHT